MPVHAQQADGIFIITVDGDHTGSEFLRVVAARFKEASRPTGILLDLSGAAGLKGQPGGAAGLFTEYADDITRIAVLTPAHVRKQPSGRTPGFVPFDSHECEAFQSRDDALAWLTREA